VGVEAIPDQAAWALNARSLHSTEEKKLALAFEEDTPRNLTKPWFSYRQRSVGFGTVMRGCVVHAPQFDGRMTDGDRMDRTGPPHRGPRRVENWHQPALLCSLQPNSRRAASNTSLTGTPAMAATPLQDSYSGAH